MDYDPTPLKKEKAPAPSKEAEGTPCTVRDPNTGKLVTDETLIDNEKDNNHG